MRVVLLPEGDDPDSFARSHSASEVQEYIAANAENFITFKTKLLLSETGNDPIKRSEVTRNIIISIAQIPDPIQRSMFIKECSQIMAADENMLISEVARHRMHSLGDNEAEAFIMRQQQQQRQQSGHSGYSNYGKRDNRPTTNSEEETQRFGEIPLSASAATLEREIIYYLLKYGQCNYEVLESGSVVELNTAQVIIEELDNVAIDFTNGTYNKILSIFREALAQSRYPSQTEIVNHADPDVCSTAVDILTLDDNYAESAIWTQRDVRSLSESTMLADGIPKLLWLYKSRTILARIAELNAKLTNDLTEEQMEEILLELSHLNKLKVQIANHLGRPII